MGLREIIDRIKQFKGLREPELLPEGQTHDPHLRSLRRMRTRQLEELEKEQLKRNISAYNKEKTRKMIGLKRKVIQEKIKRRKEGFFESSNLSKGNL